METQQNNPNFAKQGSNASIPQAYSLPDPDEINLLEYIYALVKNKWWIIGATILGFILGNIAANKKGPRWVAEVLIAPKEIESQKAPNISGLGAFGGLVANQLNISGNASLDKIELILNSREFNAKLVDQKALLPMIIKYQSPKTFKKLWDSTQNKWNPEFTQPKFLDLGGMVMGYLKKVTKANTMTITISSKDSAFSIDLANNYVTFLNEYIKENIQNDAKENVFYLEKQLNGIADPLLREKIQALISNEIEKQMVVSKEAFRIVDPVYLSKTFKEKKQYPRLIGAGMFFIVCLVVIFLHAISSANKTEEDKLWIKKIQKELLLFKK
jgi:LPS O-antigen subunit length determinant protein (WzzB/FepE family)